MTTRFIGSPLSEKDARRLWQVIRRLAMDEIKSGREFTMGVTVGAIRNKVFPVDAQPNDPTFVGFVVNVRLIEFPGQPLAVDVLVANQARQLVADAVESSDGIGTAVLLQLDPSGSLTVIGRSLVNTPSLPPRDYFDIYDIGGVDLSYLMGLETVEFGDLDADVQAGLNAYRATLSLPPLGSNDLIIIDPVIYFHGRNYFPGYIDTNNSHRFGGFGSINCQQTTQLVPWDDPRWVWAGPPVGYPATVSSWGLTESVTVCV